MYEYQPDIFGDIRVTCLQCGARNKLSTMEQAEWVVTMHTCPVDQYRHDAPPDLRGTTQQKRGAGHWTR